MALCISKRRLFSHLETTPFPQLRVAFSGRGGAKGAHPPTRACKEALTYCQGHARKVQPLRGSKVVQLLRCVWLFATPWTAARQASLSFTISRSWLRLTCVELMMSSKFLILCHLLKCCALCTSSQPPSPKGASPGIQRGGPAFEAGALVFPVGRWSLLNLEAPEDRALISLPSGCAGREAGPAPVYRSSVKRLPAPFTAGLRGWQLLIFF